MIKFECDQCGKTTTYTKTPVSIDNKIVPGQWITIDGIYYNDREGDTRKVIVGNGLKHFCCQQCFIDYHFYKRIDEQLNQTK